jgi:hypothetical protein
MDNQLKTSIHILNETRDKLSDQIQAITSLLNVKQESKCQKKQLVFTESFDTPCSDKCNLKDDKHMNGYTLLNKNIMSDMWDEINKELCLKQNEYIVFEKVAIYLDPAYSTRQFRFMKHKIFVFIVTNYSNVYWFDKYYDTCIVPSQFKYMLSHDSESENKAENKLIKKEFNTPLDANSIEALNIIIIINLVKCGIKGEDLIEYPYKEYEKVYDNIIMVLTKNKEKFVKSLDQSFFLEQYNIHVEEITKLENQLIKEKSQSKAKLKKLMRDIPFENKCIICESFTKCNKVCTPCGHYRYCNECIDVIKECALCRAEVDKVIVINRN